MPRTQSSSLKFLDVIKCDRFAEGTKCARSRFEKPMVTVGYDLGGKDSASDPTRAEALFVVLAVTVEGERGLGGPHSNWTQVVAQRLRDNRTFDPDGEKIVFKATGMAREEVIGEVEQVGYMTMQFVDKSGPQPEYDLS